MTGPLRLVHVSRREEARWTAQERVDAHELQRAASVGCDHTHEPRFDERGYARFTFSPGPLCACWAEAVARQNEDNARRRRAASTTPRRTR